MDENQPAENILQHLLNLQLIPSIDKRYEGFDEYRKHIYEEYDHGNFYSSIHPEDERLLYAISSIVKPKEAFIAGSYYGYFAIWAMKAIGEEGGTCCLSDTDSRVCRLAQQNFSRLGFSANTRVICDDSVSILSKRKEPVDLLLLDAVGKWNDPRPEYRGKIIYYPILQAAIPLLRKGSVIVMHNMRPNYFMPLIKLLESIPSMGMCYDSYNGLGVYIVR